MFLHPSPPSIAAPAAGGLCLQPTTMIRFGLRRTHRGRHGLRRSPGCSDGRRPADSFKESYTGDRLGRNHGPDRVRLRTASPPGFAGVQQQQLVLHPLLSTMVLGRQAPRPSARRANTPPRVPRPWPAPSIPATPDPAASSVLTVPRPPTATAHSLWELLSPGLRPLLATRPLHLQS